MVKDIMQNIMQEVFGVIIGIILFGVIGAIGLRKRRQLSKKTSNALKTAYNSDKSHNNSENSGIDPKSSDISLNGEISVSVQGVEITLLPLGWVVQAIISPLASNGGLKNWDMICCTHGLIFYPLGLGPSLKAGATAGLVGATDVEPSSNELIGESSQEAILRLLQLASKSISRTALRILPITNIKNITVKYRRWTASEIHIKLQGEATQVYSIYAHSQLENYRAVLDTLYHSIYEEHGFS